MKGGTYLLSLFLLMKGYLAYSSIFFIAIFLFVSCTIEKRRYSNGYHVEWHHDHQSSRDNQTVVSEEVYTDSMGQHEVDQLPNNSDLAIDTVVSIKTDPILYDHANNQEEPSTCREGEQNRTPSPKRQKQNQLLRIKGALASLSTGIVRSSSPVEIAELHPVGMALGLIGFLFALVAIACIITASYIAVDWAAIGYMIMAIIGACLAGLFAWIAQGVFFAHHQGVPWFQWPGLILGLLALYAGIRIVFKI